MSFETKCYFLHGCKWEKKDGKCHNTCQAPDTEPCKYKYLSEKPKTQTEKIAETIAARDKWWITELHSKCPHKKKGEKRSCNACMYLLEKEVGL